MAKVKTFVSFSRINALGAQRVIYRSAVTQGKDAVLVDAGVPQTPVQLATYLAGVAEDNTLYPVVTLNTTLLADLQAKAEAAVTSATAGGFKVGFKAFIGPSTQALGEGALFLTVKTPAGKEKFEYALAD